MLHLDIVKKITLLLIFVVGFVFAEGIGFSSSQNYTKFPQIKPAKSSKEYYGKDDFIKKNKRYCLRQEIDFYLQPQVGLGYNTTTNEKSIIMLGAYMALEFRNMRLGISGNVGSSFSYYGVQIEKMIPIIKDKHFITLRLGNFGRKSSNAGIFYEARIENISALLGVEFATDDIITFNTYNYAFTIGMGIILDDMNY
jgi:hypothetical protein